MATFRGVAASVVVGGGLVDQDVAIAGRTCPTRVKGDEEKTRKEMRRTLSM
jgi:hypothetical protein